MMTDETPSTDPKQQIPDLSGLADFQFGPAWARPGARFDEEDQEEIGRASCRERV